MEIFFLLGHVLFIDVMKRKIHKDHFQEPALISWKAVDRKTLSTQDTNSSKNNLELIESIRTLEIVSIQLY